MGGNTGFKGGGRKIIFCLITENVARFKMLCETCKNCKSKWLVTADWGGDWNIECAIGGTFWVTSPPEFIDLSCSLFSPEPSF